jgi:hypothetical protein
MAGRAWLARATGAAALVAMTAPLVACEVDPIRSTLQRPIDPVVLTGAQASGLVGAQPGRIVAFRASSQGWTQVPVQVDERKATTMQAIYNLPANQFSGTTLNIPVTVYADATTFVGADTNAAFDADDEIAFMARDAGGDAGTLAPPAGTTGAGVEVAIHDPADATATGFVYLFNSNGSLDPGAGKHYVSYTFGLTSGDYKTTYNRTDGPNPENSTITGASYSAHFSDRWLLDRISLTLGDRPTTDVVDRVMYRFPGLCVRNEDTFDDGEGAFVVNKVGPVRALRSYVGANSGPNTQATHAFYDTAVDTTIDLRVHAIPGVGATLDLNQQAFGMTFRSPQAPSGVPIDGTPDNVPVGTPGWWTATGSQGNLGVAASFTSNLGLTPQSYYQDDLTPSGQCTGDGQAVADSGVFFNSPIACTDPGITNCGGGTLQSRFRTIAGPPGNPSQMQGWAQQALQPLTVTTSPYP